MTQWVEGLLRRRWLLGDLRGWDGSQRVLWKMLLLLLLLLLEVLEKHGRLGLRLLLLLLLLLQGQDQPQ